MKKEKLYTIITVIVIFVAFAVGYSALRSEQEKLSNMTYSVSQSLSTTYASSTQIETIETSALNTTDFIDNTTTLPSTDISTTESTTVFTTRADTTDNTVDDGTTSVVTQFDVTDNNIIADSVITNSGAVVPYSYLQYLSEDSSASVVYFTKDITAESMAEIFKALNWTPTGKVAVKLAIGEPPSSNYLKPELIKDVVNLVNGTIVECNTAYPGARTLTATHYQVAKDHGYTAIAPVQIQDENGSMTLPVSSGKVLTENYVGAAFADYDSYLVLSHFKGHSMAGFGGAIKNISIGLASIKGKSWIHSGGKSKVNPWGWNQDTFCESMADAAKSVSDYLDNGKNIVYINVMNRISIDCDCVGLPEEPDIHDIGIMASTDPVALDQACLDIVWVSEGSEAFQSRVNERNGTHTLESAEQIGLGQRNYQLVKLDG